MADPEPLRVHVVDPSAYAPPYDHELCTALGRAGAHVELYTSPFAYGPVPEGVEYRVHRSFYRWQPGPNYVRRLAKLAQHGPDMLAYRHRARRPDIVHLQWLTVEPLDVSLLPRFCPLVFTAHEVVPRMATRAAVSARRRLYDLVDAVIVHTEHGRRRLIDELDVDPAKVELIPHGAFEYLTHQPEERPLPPELAAVEQPVVL